MSGLWYLVGWGGMLGVFLLQSLGFSWVWSGVLMRFLVVVTLGRGIHLLVWYIL